VGDPQQLSFDDLRLRLLGNAVPAGITTPVVRWRKLLALVEPPEDAGVSTAAFRAVGHALAGYANRDGRSCRPKVETLARDSGYRPRTVQYALRALERLGLIRCTSVGGRGKTSEYVLVCPVERRRRRPVGNAVDGAVKGAGDDGKGCSPMHPMSVSEDRKDPVARETPGDDVASIAQSPFAQLALRAARAQGVTEAEFWLRTGQAASS
jgi:DNA-binding transcriptional ArsR family regulator